MLHRCGVALSITVIAAACYVLYHILRDINVDKVLDAIGQIDNRAIVMASIAVACAYFTLTLYDLFAVYAIGAAMCPIASTCWRLHRLFGRHNVGRQRLQGGAVRYRIYSGWDVNAFEVAKICFLAGLTFWLGNLAVLGLGIAYHPERASAIDQLPPAVNGCWRSSSCLRSSSTSPGSGSAAPGRPRLVTVDLPDGPLTLLQIVDRTRRPVVLCARHVHAGAGRTRSRLFGSGGGVRHATAARLRSHSPGGLGVFDAAMLVGLSQMTRRGCSPHAAVQALYYIVPFFISVLLLTIREALISARGRRPCVPLADSEPPH